MGIFIAKILYNTFNNPQMKIVMLGLDQAGKTTVLYKLKLGEIVNTGPTFAFNIENFEFKKFQFTIWDISGEERIRPLWRHYLGEVEGVIFVVDSSDRKRIEIVKENLKRILSEDTLKGVPLLVLANKQDLGVMSTIEISEKLDLISIRERKWHVQGACALNGEGLYEGLDWIFSL